MKITVNTGELKAAIDSISGAVGKDEHSNMLMTFNDGLQLQANNGSINIISQSVSYIGESDKNICLNYQRIRDIIVPLTNRGIQEITLMNDGSQIVVKNGRSKYKVNTLSASDFATPSVFHKEESRIVLNKTEITAHFHNARRFSGRDDVRAMLNGVAMEVTTTELNVVATNGHFMFVGRTKPLNLDELGNMIVVVPNKGVEEIIKFMSDDKYTKEIVFSLGERSCLVKNELTGRQLITTLIDASFPDYRRVIPDSHIHSIKINRTELIEISQSAAVLADPKFMAGQFRFEGPELQVTTSNEDGNALEILGTEGFMSSSEFIIGFNLSLMITALQVRESEMITIWLSGSSDGAIITFQGDATTQVILMPVRL